MAALLTITLTGFAATIAQIVLLRELLVRFCGNELSMGLVLACWLIWNAAGCRLGASCAPQKAPGFFLPGFFLLLAAILLPVSVMIIRGAGIIWHLTPGEIPSLWPMIQICFLGTGLFCPFSGALFSICWTMYQAHPAAGKQRLPIFVFMGEGLGAAAGGLVFYFGLIGDYPAMSAVWMTSALGLLVSAGWVRPWRLFKELFGLRFTWIGMAVLFFCAIGLRDGIEKRSRQWQWGAQVVAVQDTAYHNVALTRDKDQYSFFANGLWLFSTPDPSNREHAVHPALLQHPAPKTVLLLGGGIAGLVEEILKHPGIQRIDYVEPDREMIGFAKRYLPSEAARFPTASRLHLIHQDIGAFLRTETSRFDVILMNTGDPVNAGMNRFYTEEFFTGIQNRLSLDGVFSFAVSGGEDMLGAAQIRYLRSIYRTLTLVFPDVTLYPGDPFRFIAASGTGKLLRNPDDLVTRIEDRNLFLSYVRADTLRDRMSPFRLDYFQSILAEASDAIHPNRDFSPTCYVEALILWSAQWHPKIREAIEWVAGGRSGWLWGLFAIAGALLFFWAARGRIPITAAVAGSVLVAGGATMVLQMVLLLAFQILEGFLYLQLALILSFFMAGLSAGAAWISVQAKSPQVIRRFTQVQALIGLYPLFLIAILYLLHGKFRLAVSSTFLTWLFPALSFIAGVLGGALFSLAVEVLSETGFPLKSAGGRLYALDLTGAAAGLLLTTFLLLPVCGLIHTLLSVSGAVLLGLIPFIFHAPTNGIRR
jgi:spermidine synthase